jgi:hypothetical protein
VADEAARDNARKASFDYFFCSFGSCTIIFNVELVLQVHRAAKAAI